MEAASTAHFEAADDAAVTERLDGTTLWLCINRPEALNSISDDVITLLRAGLDRAEGDSGIRVVVVTGNGRGFCAGADLKDIGGSSESSNEFRRLFGDVLNRIEAFEKPVIAAVNGIAMAGGFELVLCCDMVIAAESAQLGDGHSNYGLLPGGGGSVRLPRRIGRNRALEMFFTGDLFDAADLESWGLINHVVPDGQLQLEASRLAARLADRSSLGIARMKRLVRETAEQPTATGLSLELLYSALHEKSHDMAEGVSAFVEKRRPHFNGS